MFALEKCQETSKCPKWPPAKRSILLPIIITSSSSPLRIQERNQSCLPNSWYEIECLSFVLLISNFDIASTRFSGFSQKDFFDVASKEKYVLRKVKISYNYCFEAWNRLKRLNYSRLQSIDKCTYFRCSLKRLSSFWFPWGNLFSKKFIPFPLNKCSSRMSLFSKPFLSAAHLDMMNNE